MMGRRVKLALTLAISGVLFANSSPAKGAACCMSASAVGIGRLLNWERFAMGLRTTASAGLGDWDSEGDWRAYSEDYADTQWRSELWALVGLGQRASIFGRLPWMLNFRHVGNLGNGTGGGLADVQLGARFELLSIGEILYLPAVAVTFAVTAPTGRPPSASDVTGASVTSRGGWALGGGVSFEHTSVPYFARFDVGVSVPLPHDGRRFGASVTLALTGGYELSTGLVISVYARLLREGALWIDGAVIDDSQRSDAGLGLAVSYRFNPHWTLQAAIDSGLFIDGLGDNQQGRVAPTLGIRYGYF